MAAVADQLRTLESRIMALDGKVDGLQKLEDRLTSQEKKTGRLQDGLFAMFRRRLWGARRVPTAPALTDPPNAQAAE